MADNKNNEKKKLKVAFPHMGTIYVAWGTALRKMGLEPFIPPYSSKRTLSLGAKYSPEAICLPYKLILGNFIEALQGGADMVAMISSPGICRLGEYGQSIRNVLKDLGYENKYIELQLYDGFAGMWRFMNELGVTNPITIINVLIIGVRKVFTMDKLEKVLSFYRAREITPGTAEKAFNRGTKWVYEADTLKELKKAEKRAIEEIRKTPIDKTKDILYVDITGEIYLVLDYFSNQNVLRELGKMGVQTRRSLTVSGFLRDAIIPKWMKKKNLETHLERAPKLARPWLKRDIGGDALEVISDVHFANRQKKDGIIHISPFTCMPEIMSQNIFPKMRENVDIPILPLIMDEQTGKAGYLTRLEAFVDLMRRKKRKREMDAKAKIINKVKDKVIEVKDKVIEVKDRVLSK